MNRIKHILVVLAAMLSVAVGAQAAETAVPSQSHFAWGVDIGSSIDLDSEDMTTVNLEAYFGYRNSWINILGVGAGIDMMINNSSRYYPVYAIFRTNFTTRPTLCFFDLRTGAAFNQLSDNTTQTCFYINPSLGINLVRGKTFSSYVSVGYIYNGLDSFGPADDRTSLRHGLNMANIRIGITF